MQLSLWLFLHTWANLHICKDTYVCKFCARELHLCFWRIQHTYPKSFTIVWSSMLHQNILTIHFFVLMSYIISIFIHDIVTILFIHASSLFSESKCRTVLLESVASRQIIISMWPAGQTMISMWSMSLHMHIYRPFLTIFSNTAQKRIKYKKKTKWMYTLLKTIYIIK